MTADTLTSLQPPRAPDAPRGDRSTDDDHAAQPDVQRMLELSAGYVQPRCLWIAAELGLGDLLAGGALPSRELAAAAGADPDALQRVLRVLSSMGVLDEVAPSCFALTRLGQLLRSDVPQSMRAWVLMTGMSIYESFSGALHSIRTGEPAFDRVHGMPKYQYFREVRREAEAFNTAMRVFGAQAAGALRGYDFSGVSTVCDVGAGPGTVIFSVLEANPSLRGVLFDLPHVAELARGPLGEAGLSDRCAVVGGDFFEAVPSADLLILSSILHSWSDEDAVAILRSCRRALAPGGRLVVIEMLVPPGSEPHFSKQTDLVMLVVSGGRERTEQEYGELFAAAGLRLTRALRTPYLVSLIEAQHAE